LLWLLGCLAILGSKRPVCLYRKPRRRAAASWRASTLVSCLLRSLSIWMRARAWLTLSFSLESWTAWPWRQMVVKGSFSFCPGFRPGSSVSLVYLIVRINGPSSGGVLGEGLIEGLTAHGDGNSWTGSWRAWPACVSGTPVSPGRGPGRAARAQWSPFGPEAPALLFLRGLGCGLLGPRRGRLLFLRSFGTQLGCGRGLFGP